jgi:hypothetical protein
MKTIHELVRDGMTQVEQKRRQQEQQQIQHELWLKGFEGVNAWSKAAQEQIPRRRNIT